MTLPDEHHMMLTRTDSQHPFAPQCRILKAAVKTLCSIQGRFLIDRKLTMVVIRPGNGLQTLDQYSRVCATSEISILIKELAK